VSLYDRVASKPGGEAALAAARLRREILVALHQAFTASGLKTQTEIARRLNVRKSAVSQVLRGDGNLQGSQGRPSLSDELQYLRTWR
jgi:predicted XRE-type DNA-binding protein